MEKSCCSPGSLPPYLYRVQYEGSQTAWSGYGDDLAARDTYTTYDESKIPAFRQSIINQFTWEHRRPQPYISCFSDMEHALNWAFKAPWRRGPAPVSKVFAFVTIDTNQLRETQIFSVNELASRFRIALPDRASQHTEGAYLCLHRIPNSALVPPSEADIAPEEVIREIESMFREGEL